MIYGYIRVSSDKQTTENQRFEIENYSKLKEMPIGEWVEYWESTGLLLVHLSKNII